MRHWLRSSSDEHVYIFHHIPKCGGTSIGKAFRAWFRCIQDYRPQWATGRKLERFRSHPLELARLKPGTMVCGHYEVDGIYLHQRYPAVFRNPKYRIVTFVREPLSLRLSLLRYEKEKGRWATDKPLEELLFERANWLSDRFPCSLEDQDQVLDRYFFIGIAEQSQACFDRLADLLGKPRIRLRHLNRSNNGPNELSSELRRRFEEAHHRDYVLYRRCLRRQLET
jgi:hypothetical protein